MEILAAKSMLSRFRKLPLLLLAMGCLSDAQQVTAIDPAIDDAAFHKAVEASRDPFLKICAHRLGFHSLKVDARDAKAQFAVRVYALSSWGSKRVTIYRKVNTEGGADRPAPYWQATIEDLGSVNGTHQPPKGRTVDLDQQFVARLEKVLAANDLSSLPANGLGRFTEDGGSCTLEIMDGESYRWWYRAEPGNLEGPFDKVVEEVLSCRKLGQ